MNIREDMRVRHLKRGTTYRVIGRAKLQIGPETMQEHWIAAATCRMVEEKLERITCVVYQSEHDDSIWVRPESEFIDGRFVEID